MTNPVEIEAEKRRLRREIARLRGLVLLDGVRLARGTARLGSWRKWVRRFPAPAAVAAVGVGWVEACGLRRGKWARRVGLKLVHLAVGPIKAGLWRDATRFFAAMTDGEDRSSSPAEPKSGL